MKVKVSFDGTTVVVPCGSGDDEVRSLFEKAAHRYKKATGKAESVAVNVSALHLAADDAVVLPDDVISDVLDDKDLLVAIFTVTGDDGSVPSRVLSSSGASNASSSAASSPSPVPASLTPSPIGDVHRHGNSAGAAGSSDGDERRRYLEELPSARNTTQQLLPSSPRKLSTAFSTTVPPPEPPAAYAPTSLPDDPEQTFNMIPMASMGGGRSQSISVVSLPMPSTVSCAIDLPRMSTVGAGRRASSPAHSPLTSIGGDRSQSPRRQQPIVRSPMANRKRRAAKASHSNSEQDEEEDDFGPPQRIFHRTVPTSVSGGSIGVGGGAASSSDQLGGLRAVGVAANAAGGSGARGSTMKPSRYLMQKWEAQEQRQQRQWTEQRLKDTQSVSAPSAPPSQPLQQLQQQQQWEAAQEDEDEDQQQHLQPSQAAAQSQSGSRTKLMSTGQQLATIELSCRCEGDQVGIYVRGYRTSDDRDIGVFVREIRTGSVAAENGLIQIADRLVCVNGMDLTDLSNDQAVALFQDAVRRGTMRLQVSRAVGSLDDTANSPSPSPPPTLDLPTSSASLAASQGRWQQKQQQDSAGGGLGGRGMGPEEVFDAPTLQTHPAMSSVSTLMSSASTIDMQQAQESASAAEQVQQRGVLPATNTLPSTAGRRVGRRLDIVLDKGPTGGLGFSVTSRDVAVGNDQDRPVYIKAVTPGGLAFRDARLRANDRLLEVDGTSLTGLTQKEAVQVLKSTAGQVSLTVWREESVVDNDSSSGQHRKTSSSTSPTATGEQKAIEVTTSSAAKSPPPSPSKDVGGSAKLAPPPPPTTQAPGMATNAVVAGSRKQLLFTIPLTSSGSAGLGISVKGKTAMSGGGDQRADQGDVGHGIYIKNVLPGGAAAKDGRLQSSDRLVSINGENLSSLSDYDAFESLRKCMAEASQRPSIDLVIERRHHGAAAGGSSVSPGARRSAAADKKRAPNSAGSQDSSAASATTAAAAAGGGVTATTSTAVAKKTASGAPRERSIEGEVLPRPRDPPSASAKQHALTIGQHIQLQQVAPTPPSTITTAAAGTHHLAVASKKHSASEVSTDSGVSGDTGAAATATHALDGFDTTAAMPALTLERTTASSTSPASHRLSKTEALGGRGFQSGSLLEALKLRNAATTATASNEDATSNGHATLAYAPGDRRGDAQAAATKSPVTTKKAGWRSGGSKSSSSLLTKVVVVANSSDGNAADGRPPMLRSNSKTQTLVELVSDGALTGKGTRIVPAPTLGEDSDRGTSPGPSEPTKVSVRAMQVDPPSRVIIHQVEMPIFTKSPTEEHVRPLDSRPESAPPISRHKVFVSGNQGHRYDYDPSGGDPHDHLDMDDDGASPRRRHDDAAGGADSREESPVVLRKPGDQRGGSSPAVRKNHAMSVMNQPSSRRQQAGSPDDDDDEEIERRVHYEEKLRISELPKDVDDWSRVKIKYPHGLATLPRSASKKARQRSRLPQVNSQEQAEDSLADAETLAGNARSRKPIYLNPDGEQDLSGDGEYDDDGDPIPHGDGDVNTSTEMDEDIVGNPPLLSRSGPGRKSMSERGHTSLNPKNYKLFNQIKERKKVAGKSVSAEGDGDGLDQSPENSNNRRFSSSSVQSGHRRAASLESLPVLVGSVGGGGGGGGGSGGSGSDNVSIADKVSITDNISNSPKARRLLGIQSEGGNHSNVRPAFQRRQSYEKGVTSPEHSEGLGGELVGRQSGDSSTIQFGAKPSYGGKSKSKKLFSSFLKGIGKNQRRPRGMPAPLPPLHSAAHGTPSHSTQSIDSSSVGSPGSTDTSSISLFPVASKADHAHQVATGNGPISVGGGNGVGVTAGDEWSAADGRYDDPDDTGSLHLQGFQSEIQLREGSSLDQLREETVRSGSAHDVRFSSSQGDLSPVSPLLVQPPVLMVKDTI